MPLENWEKTVLFQKLDEFEKRLDKIQQKLLEVEAQLISCKAEYSASNAITVLEKK